jgi:chromosome segregation protein
MHFKRLRLTGFKSFVDPTELHIESGLTGVVGPNGCGKSNLLEALRWVMGETSSKSLRGAGMEDVIFAGTTGRAARAFADVSLLLDNQDRRAPAGFNEADELEVTRRIERDLGSAYRVNGKDVRQKDVQLLFADAATGAHSPALVSQGRIGAIISAKPADRRAILEEAAGISGLHARRKEAEQRLRAAEANLERVDDVLRQMDGQKASLQRQSKQAERYKVVAAEIRSAEAMLLYRRWADAREKLAQAETDLKTIDSEVTRLTSEVAQASAEQARLAAGLPDLRSKEADAAAVLQRLTLAREELASEAKRIEARRDELTRLCADLARDQQRESSLESDAIEALDRLADEDKALSARLENAEADIATAQAKVADAEQLASDHQRHFDQLVETNAEALARKRALDTQAEAARQRALRLGEDIARLGAERDRLETDAARSSPLGQAQAMVSEAEAALAALLEQISNAEEARSKAEAARESQRRAQQSAREAARAKADALRETARRDADALREAAQARLREAKATLAALDAEKASLDRLLAASAPKDGGTPVLDQLKVAPGFEAALNAALADDLAVPVGGAHARRWSEADSRTSSDPALPSAAVPLANHVDAPAGLARRLASIGVVEAADAAALVSQLKPGQRLVSRDGQLWRWDGFVAAKPASGAAAERLVQRNRMAALVAELDGVRAAAAQAEQAAQTATAEAQAKVSAAQSEASTLVTSADQSAQAALASADQAVAQAQEAERSVRARRRELEVKLDAARGEAAKLAREATQRDTRLQGLADTLTRLIEEKAARDTEVAQAQELMSALPNLERLALELTEQRKIVERCRAELAAARAELDGLSRRAAADSARREAIARDDAQWRARLDGGRTQAQALTERAAAATAELAATQARPAALAADQERLAGQLHEAGQVRASIADALAEAEAALARQDSLARALSEQLASTREGRARLDAAVEHHGARGHELALQVGEAYQCPPPLLPEKVGFDADAIPDLAMLEPKLDRLKAERERMGAVNLRADIELAELETEAVRIVTDRDELIEAINKLRHAIGSLNREGRQALLKAFDAVNAHFSRLFARLFGGGEAHLALIESDDPLEAGLEIMASPPGKRLQHLGLLSGGEQALTALALIFAVFLTNPAPICVLDEVDAPLDDANVERFCDLLDAMVGETETRFLIVTHNAVTMSRMDRLFGVTMAERGVSQLVSVDLRRAEQLLAAE